MVDQQDVDLQSGGEASSATSVRLSSLPSTPLEAMMVGAMVGGAPLMGAHFPAGPPLTAVRFDGDS